MKDQSRIANTPLLDDQPASLDLLNFSEFANALREVIINPGTRTPFIVGIFGRWGTGKTTLMRMLERDLAARDATTVWFSAWLYGQETEIWAAFLQSLTSRLAARLRFAEANRYYRRFSLSVFRFLLDVFPSGAHWIVRRLSAG